MSRSWARGLVKIPYFSLTPEKEAAKHLRLIADRFVNDRANAHEVEEAFWAWQEARAAKIEPEAIIESEPT